MISKVVEYVTDKNTKRFGVVVDKIDMIHSDQQSVVTGYMIQDLNGKITAVLYWKIVKVLESEEEKREEQESSEFLNIGKSSPKGKKAVLKQAEEKEWIQNIVDSPFKKHKEFPDDLPF